MTPQQQAVAYAVESLVIAKEYGHPDEYAIDAAISELHALSPACTHHYDDACGCTRCDRERRGYLTGAVA